MDYYVDLILLADAETNVNQVRTTVFDRLHLVLVDLGTHSVGVGFPKLRDDANLGAVIRLHGGELELREICVAKKISQMRDYVEVGPIIRVPDGVKYRSVRRAQSKSNPERLRRRLRKRHNLSEEEALARIPDSAGSFLALPFLNVRSGSSKQHFRLFLRHGPVVDEAVSGDFNSYGLSAKATIPWF